MNADGSYWTPEQYPKAKWVAAKGPSVDPSTLSGFNCANPIVIDESFDSNYKLFKNQTGEVFANFVGTNCRNGSPMKKIWVPKSLVETLPVNVVMTPTVKKTYPRPKSSYKGKASYEHTKNYVSQERNYQTQEYEYSAS